MPGISKFIETLEFSRLTEIKFDAKITEASKNLAFKMQIDYALDLADKNKAQIKNIGLKQKQKTLDLSYFIGKSYFYDHGS